MQSVIKGHRRNIQDPLVPGWNGVVDPDGCQLLFLADLTLWVIDQVNLESSPGYAEINDSLPNASMVGWLHLPSGI